MSTLYQDLDEQSQIAVVRTVAEAAVQEFGLRAPVLELVSHAYNTTFRVDTADGSRLALRVNTNSVSSPEEITAQQAWQHALATETDVVVPDPWRTPDGAWFATVPGMDPGTTVHATLSSWLDGDDLGTDVSPEHARALGRATARLHDHAEVWRMPAGAGLPTFDTPLFGDPDRLSGYAGYDDAAHAVVRAAMERCDHAFARLYAGARPIPVHADLHGSNLKWHDDRLAVFDFDDAGLGIPVLDLAISTFYLREHTGSVEAALLAGYGEIRPLPEVAQADVEALVAARQLLLANGLLCSTTSSLRGQAADYAAVTVERLEGWLRTGRFTRTPLTG